MLQTTLLLLKFLGLLSAGIFGVIGTLHDYKDDAGQITTWGKIGLSGIILGTVIAISAHIVESVKDQEDAAKTQKRVEKQLNNQTKILDEINTQSTQSGIILDNIKKANSLFSEISGTAFTQISGSNRSVDRYVSRIKNEIDELLRTGVSDERGFYTSRYGRSDSGGHIITGITVDKSSKRFPKESDQPFIDMLSVPIAVQIYKNPINYEEFKPAIQVGNGQPDFQFRLNEESVDLVITIPDYSVNTQTGYTTDKENWSNNGEITSVNDLLGCQIWFYLSLPDGYANSDGLTSEMKQMENNIEIISICLRINHVGYWFQNKQLTRIATSDGRPAWTIILPQEEQEFSQNHIP